MTYPTFIESDDGWCSFGDISKILGLEKWGSSVFYADHIVGFLISDVGRRRFEIKVIVGGQVGLVDTELMS